MLRQGWNGAIMEKNQQLNTSLQVEKSQPYHEEKRCEQSWSFFFFDSVQLHFKCLPLRNDSEDKAADDWMNCIVGRHQSKEIERSNPRLWRKFSSVKTEPKLVKDLWDRREKKRKLVIAWLLVPWYYLSLTRARHIDTRGEHEHEAVSMPSRHFLVSLGTSVSRWWQKPDDKDECWKDENMRGRHFMGHWSKFHLYIHLKQRAPSNFVQHTHEVSGNMMN